MNDDEDGVILPSSLSPGSIANVTVTASVAGCLNTWGDRTMKIDELEALVSEMDIQDLLLRPSDLALDVGIWHSYPVPNCENCRGRCCAKRLDLRLFDIARSDISDFAL